MDSPLNVSYAEFFHFMVQFLCLQMCVYGGSAVPQGGVGDRHLVTVPQGVVGDRLPWGGERQGAGGVPSTTPLPVDHLLEKLFKYLTRCAHGARAVHARCARGADTPPNPPQNLGISLWPHILRGYLHLQSFFLFLAMNLSPRPREILQIPICLLEWVYPAAFLRPVAWGQLGSKVFLLFSGRPAWCESPLWILYVSVRM